MLQRIIFLYLIMASPSASAAEGIALYNELRASVVTVQGFTPTPPSHDGKIGMFHTTGAGIILDEQGIIATNTHVIYGAQYIQVTLPTGEKLNASIVYIAPSEDVSPAEDNLLPALNSNHLGGF